MNEQTTIPNNTEIDKALKEFEVESASPQEKQSSERTSIPQKEVEGVKFEVPNYGAVKYYNETDTPKIVKLVMKLSSGAIKEQKQAEYVLLGFVVVMLALSFYFFFFSGTNKKMPVPIDIQNGGQIKFVE